MNLVEKWQKQLDLFPQEKMYLHLDKPTYLSGENIWFRSYLVDASSHQSMNNSRYVYVELVSEQDSVISRVMIRPDSLNHFCGYLPIPENSFAGEYNVRAYTSYMLNRPDYLFIKNISVLSHAKRNGLLQEHAYEDDFDVQFFPEGGQIINERLCKIAFKATAPNGLSCQMHGFVLDDKGDTLTSFASSHAGMGYFSLKGQIGRRYLAECYVDSGKKKRFTLPEATNTFALKVEHARERIAISISKPLQSLFPSDSLYLLIHTRGIVQYYDRWKSDQETTWVNTQSFPSGITQIVLLDAANNPISERLVFCLNKDLPTLSVTSDKLCYGKRELIHLDISLAELMGQKMIGDCSLSVTDDRDLLPDTLSTIVSDILLTSELKGYVENPAYYLQSNRMSSNAADLLMLTQGWRRYDMAGLLKNRFLTPVIPNEVSQSVNGYVENGSFKKGATADGQIVLVVPDFDYSDITVSNKDGFFRFDGFEFPDSTQLWIQSLNKKRSWEQVYLRLDQFPASPMNQFYYSSNRKIDAIEYQLKATEKYLSDKGIRTIALPNIDVQTPSKNRGFQNTSFYSNLNTYQLDAKEIARINPIHTSDLFRYLPGMLERNFNTLGANLDLVVVDDQIIDEFDINTLAVSTIESIGVISGPKMNTFGLRGSPIVGEGSITPRKAIVITTKKYADAVSVQKNKALKSNLLFGYQKPVEFYSPKYDVPDTSFSKDLRTTIYWNPSVQVDSDRKTRISFYSADMPSVYSVIIEGVTENGSLIRCSHKIDVTKR